MIFIKSKLEKAEYLLSIIFSYVTFGLRGPRGDIERKKLWIPPVLFYLKKIDTIVMIQGHLQCEKGEVERIKWNQIWGYNLYIQI